MVKADDIEVDQIAVQFNFPGNLNQTHKRRKKNEFSLFLNGSLAGPPEWEGGSLRESRPKMEMWNAVKGAQTRLFKRSNLLFLA